MDSKRTNEAIDTEPEFKRSKTLVTEIHEACMKGETEKVANILKDSENFDMKEIDKKGTLIFALKKGHNEIVEALLKYGADANSKTKHGESVLHIASKLGNVVIVRKLLENGANINAVSKISKQTPLHSASEKGQIEVIKELLKYNPLLDVKDTNNKTPLYYAFTFGFSGHMDVVKLLVKSGADINNVSMQQTILHIAASKRDDVFTTFLLENGAIVDIKDRKGKTALHVAVESENVKNVLKLLQHGANVDLQDNLGLTPLHCAIYWKNLSIVKLLLEFKANIEIGDLSGITPLEFTMECNHINIMLEILKHVDINDPSISGLAPLHFASKLAAHEMVKVLLENGANTNTLDRQKFTPLHYISSAGNTPNDLNTLKELLRYGANVNATPLNHMKFTPLHAATDYGHDKIVKELLHHGADFEAVTMEGNRPLHNASQAGSLKCIKMLFEKKCEVNVVNNKNETPLQLAVFNGKKVTVSLLLKNGANVNIQDQNGETALHAAVLYFSRNKKKDSTIVGKLLAQDHINFSLKDRYGKTALQIALENDYKDVARMIAKRALLASKITHSIYPLKEFL